MTQRTINLYDGLEVLYYMDSAYFDSGANELSDLSGNELHATAKNGVTAGGVEGPDALEAASFDGTDDHFTTPSTTSYRTWTWHVVFKATTNIVNAGWTCTSNSGGEKRIYHPNSNRIRYVDENFNDVLMFSLSNDVWTTMTITARGSNDTLYGWKNGEFQSSYQTSSPSTLMEFDRVGKTDTGPRYFTGNIAVWGQWSRELNKAEIQALNHMTGPMKGI